MTYYRPSHPLRQITISGEELVWILYGAWNSNRPVRCQALSHPNCPLEQVDLFSTVEPEATYQYLKNSPLLCLEDPIRYQSLVWVVLEGYLRESHYALRAKHKRRVRAQAFLSRLKRAVRIAGDGFEAETRPEIVNWIERWGERRCSNETFWEALRPHWVGHSLMTRDAWHTLEVRLEKDVPGCQAVWETIEECRRLFLRYGNRESVKEATADGQLFVL